MKRREFLKACVVAIGGGGAIAVAAGETTWTESLYYDPMARTLAGYINGERLFLVTGETETRPIGISYWLQKGPAEELQIPLYPHAGLEIEWF